MEAQQAKRAGWTLFAAGVITGIWSLVEYSQFWPWVALGCFAGGVAVHRSRRMIVYTVLAILWIGATYWTWLPRGPF